MLNPWLLIFCLVAQDVPPVRSTVQMTRPDQHFYQIDMSFPGRNRENRELKMAAWTPGSYKIRDFARNVEGFQAFDTEDKPLSWRKTDKATWVIEVPKETPFKISYRVFAFEHTVRTSYLDSFYGFINPASVFFYEPGTAFPYEVLTFPEQGWLAASALPQLSTNRFIAANWDQLVDSPFQFGPFRRHDFDVRGIPHHWYIDGDLNMNEPEMVDAIRRIGETVGDLFDAYPFKDYYIFSLFRLDGAGGGLEHANSTMVQGSSDIFRDKKGWDKFLSLMIHEYYHAWNVKAIHDKVLGPFDYQNESYSELLWLHEGFTSYYDILLMGRAGFWDEKELLKKFAEEVQTYLDRPGVLYQSLTEASFNAWIHQYQPSETSRNSRISYYQAGSMAALAFDLLLRHKTRNKESLDGFMATLYRDYGAKGKAIDWHVVRNLAQKVAGEDGADFFDTYLRGVNPLPMDSFLAYAGLDMIYLDPDEEEDKKEENKEAGKEEAEGEVAPAEKKPFDPFPKVTLGIDTTARNDAMFVANVKREGAGWKAGLDFDDEILAINGRRVSQDNFERILAWSRPGDEVAVLVSRANKILTLKVVLEPQPKKLKLVPNPDASSLQKRIFADLFRQPESEPKPGDNLHGDN